MAPSQHEIVDALRRVTIPGTGTNLVTGGAVRSLEVDGGTVRMLIEVESAQLDLPERLRAAAEEALRSLEGVEQVSVEARATLPSAGPGGPAPQPVAKPEPAWAERIPEVRHVIAVASGKGGVGKSTVAANLALALAARDLEVGLLDADIYGPSQQLMMGVTEDPQGDESGKIYPIGAPGGVKVMSFGFLVDPDQPVIWRGPMLMKALEQLVGDVLWGSLDVLVVDLPPGTGDVALTLCQNVPMSGAVIVSTPQDVALIDARKGLNMFHRLGVPVLGIVENMSSFACPECGHTSHIFGDGGGRRTAAELGIPFLGGIPLDPAVVAGGDSGTPVVLEHPSSAAAQAFTELARQVAERLESRG